ncbi:MAG: B12-binding domain-containing radical SAM protein [Planctomycetota bacterium]|jgi:radical SAM superfamily enzyme YgiQ (UPF0313 family)
MRILFVYLTPKPWLKTYVGYHEGLAVLSATVRRRGHQPSMLILNEPDRTAMSNAVKKCKPDIAALSIASPQMPLARKAADILAGDFRLTLVAGGAHPTIKPEETLELPGMCCVFRGESDHVFADWIDKYENGESRDGLSNISYRNGNLVENNPVGFPEDLDDLPFPDRSVFPMREMLDYNADLVGAEFIASRGCPFGCDYCSNRAFNELRGGVHHRRKSVGRMLDEIESVVSEYREARRIGFNDDVFTLDRDWMLEFCAEYPGRFDRPWWANTQVGLIDEEMVAAMAESGCERLHMGVETGSEKLRREVLNKKVSDGEIVRAFEMVHDYGMKTVAFMMLGVPGETEKTLAESVEFCRRLQPQWIVVSLFEPFPGTVLGERAIADGLADGNLREDYYHPRPPLRLPDISAERLLWYYRNFNDLVRRKKRL